MGADKFHDMRKAAKFASQGEKEQKDDDW